MTAQRLELTWKGRNEKEKDTKPIISTTKSKHTHQLNCERSLFLRLSLSHTHLHVKKYTPEFCTIRDKIAERQGRSL
jgi:hypothetical protein